MTSLHPVVARVTARVRERSAASRQAYLARIAAARGDGPQRGRISCTNLAHAMAASPPTTSSPSASSADPTSPSSRPTATCSRRTSRSSTIPS